MLFTKYKTRNKFSVILMYETVKKFNSFYFWIIASASHYFVRALSYDYYVRSYFPQSTSQRTSEFTIVYKEDERRECASDLSRMGPKAWSLQTACKHIYIQYEKRNRRALTGYFKGALA